VKLGLDSRGDAAGAMPQNSVCEYWRGTLHFHERFTVQRTVLVPYKYQHSHTARGLEVPGTCMTQSVLVGCIFWKMPCTTNLLAGVAGILRTEVQFFHSSFPVESNSLARDIRRDGD